MTSMSLLKFLQMQHQLNMKSIYKCYLTKDGRQIPIETQTSNVTGKEEIKKDE